MNNPSLQQPAKTEPPIVVAAFYHFFPLKDALKLRIQLRSLMDQHQVKGSILLAPDGINSTISGTRTGIDAILGFLRGFPEMENLEHKESYHETQAFRRAKVRLKKETVTFKQDEDPTQPVGTYVSPSEWNELIGQNDVLLLDTRNAFEVEMGTFQGAINPNIPHFSHLALYTETHLDPQKHKRVATFCTGGIRCEKYTRYLLAKGFQEVYHLKGGILKYLEEIPEEQSRWQGACFVFDERVGLLHGLKPIEKTDLEEGSQKGECC